MNGNLTTLRLFRWSLVIESALLVIQYVLGMAVNLYTEFPGDLPEGNAWHWAFSNRTLVPIHVLVGTALVLGAVAVLILGVAARTKPGMIAATLGIVMTALAYLSGVSFLSHGQEKASSLLMAVGFIGALLSYVVGFAMSRPPRPATSR